MNTQGTVVTEVGMCRSVWFLCKYEKYLQNSSEQLKKLVVTKSSPLVPSVSVTEALPFLSVLIPCTQAVERCEPLHTSVVYFCRCFKCALMVSYKMQSGRVA